MPDSGMNLIAGVRQEGSGAKFTSLNPATGEILWSGRNSTPDDVDAAISAARIALKDWSSRTLDQRLEPVMAFRKILERRADELAGIISREVGKPVWDARTEVQAMLAKVPVSVEALRQRRSESHLDLGEAQGVTRFKPHGVLAVFGPFNFPGHISHGHIIPALLAGNTVVFKPSELTPLTAEATTSLWIEAGLPPGVLNLVQGDRRTGQALVAHPGHNGVLFTGSLAAGLAISRVLVERPEVLVALELGGNNPLVVHDVENIPAAVYATLLSAYITSGQRCTCARRLIVPPGNEEFIADLTRAVSRITVGRPDGEPQPFMGPLIRAAAADRVLAEQQRLLDAGARTLVAAERLPMGDAFVSPGLIDATDVIHREDEEVFGPLLQLIRVPSFESAVAEAADTRYGLVAGLLTKRPDLFQQFFREVNAGVINWNRPTTGASGRLPFGGVGRSGNHRPAGYFTADLCNVPVASLESPVLSLPESLVPGVTLS